jgi:hypothetical protein
MQSEKLVSIWSSFDKLNKILDLTCKCQLFEMTLVLST